ncbi:serine phosphatase RsbU (regulator of sigma subunit) [Catenulispora sp. EB89]|uniref:SpoIIE family protein phosphatase n=1 Tax=Catenulispora sp. EB89 TaxID=3156257 RepID=UPI0035141B70
MPEDAAGPSSEATAEPNAALADAQAAAAPDPRAAAQAAAGPSSQTAAPTGAPADGLAGAPVGAQAAEPAGALADAQATAAPDPRAAAQAVAGPSSQIAAPTGAHTDGLAGAQAGARTSSQIAVPTGAPTGGLADAQAAAGPSSQDAESAGAQAAEPTDAQADVLAGARVEMLAAAHLPAAPATVTTTLPAGQPAAGIGRLAATVGRLQSLLHDAESSADVRVLIALARGILMERLHIAPAAAARQLEELAERSGVPVVELAADIVNEIAGDPLGEVARASVSDPRRATAGAQALNVRLRAAEAGVLTASDVHAAAGSLHRQALEPLGAVAVAVWALAADGSLLLAGYSGFAAAEARSWYQTPPGVETAARRAIRTRATHWSKGPDRAPSIGERTLGPDAVRVAIPAQLGGRLLGVLEVCWPGPVGELPQPVHRQLQALAELCAHTLDIMPADQPGGFGPSGGQGGQGGQSGQNQSGYNGHNGNGPGAPGQGPAPVAPGLSDLLDGLLEPALVLQPQYDAAGVLADFRIVHANRRFVDPVGRPSAAILGTPFLQAYPLSAEDGGLYERIEHVHATGEPFHHDRVVLRALIAGIPVSTSLTVGISRLGPSLVLTWHPEDEETRLARLLQHAQRLGRLGGFEENLLTGEVTWSGELFELFALPGTAQPVPIRELAAHAHADDVAAISRFVRTVLHHRTHASAAFRLQRGDGVQRYIRIVAEPVLEDGTMTAVRGACQDVSAQHWTEIALAATRDRLEHSEREVEESNRLTLRLQRAIMPVAPTLIDAMGLQIATRYRPAEKGHLVGGDWYDAVVLPNGRILLVVGDVAGHGIDAATEMVALRNALRGLAATGATPSQMLNWLGTVAHHLSGNVVTATVICGIYNPEDRVFRWSRAGHPPPLLVRDGVTAVPPTPEGILLGALGEARYEEQVLQLQPGDRLLMYTDGLIERRDRDIEESLSDLLKLVQPDIDSLEGQLEHLLLHSNADTDDDTCLVGVEVR